MHIQYIISYPFIFTLLFHINIIEYFTKNKRSFIGILPTPLITIHRSNSNIKLIATLLSTTRATYLNSMIRLETTTIPLPLDLSPRYSRPSQMPAIRPQSKSQISSQSPRIVWPLPAEILDLFHVKRATIGDNAIHSAWYTAQRLSTIGIRRNSALLSRSPRIPVSDLWRLIPLTDEFCFRLAAPIAD